MTRPRLLDLQIDSDVATRLGARSLYLGGNGYVYFSTNRTGPVTLHSYVMAGTRPGQHIDHIDDDKLNNKRSNLRFVKPAVNQANRQRLSSANTSGVRGVALSPASRKKPWRAQITVAGKNRHLGLFVTRDEAIRARKAAEVLAFGEVCP